MVAIRVSRHSETRRKSLRQSPYITTRRIVSPTSAQHFGSREQHSTATLLATKPPTLQVEADKNEDRRHFANDRFLRDVDLICLRQAHKRSPAPAALRAL